MSSALAKVVFFVFLIFAIGTRSQDTNPGDIEFTAESGINNNEVIFGNQVTIYWSGDVPNDMTLALVSPDDGTNPNNGATLVQVLSSGSSMDSSQNFAWTPDPNNSIDTSNAPTLPNISTPNSNAPNTLQTNTPYGFALSNGTNSIFGQPFMLVNAPSPSSSTSSSLSSTSSPSTSTSSKENKTPSSTGAQTSKTSPPSTTLTPTGANNSASTAAASSKSSLTTGQKAGIAIPVVFGSLAIVGAIVFFLWRRKQNKSPQKNLEEGNDLLNGKDKPNPPVSAPTNYFGLPAALRKTNFDTPILVPDQQVESAFPHSEHPSIAVKPLNLKTKTPKTSASRSNIFGLKTPVNMFGVSFWRHEKESPKAENVQQLEELSRLILGEKRKSAEETSVYGGSKFPEKVYGAQELDSMSVGDRGENVQMSGGLKPETPLADISHELSASKTRSPVELPSDMAWNV